MPKARLADRWAVITHRREGKTVAEIQRATGWTRSFVRRWAAASDEDRGADDQPRPGRPPKLTPAIRKTIKRCIEGKKHASTRQVAARVGLSHETVRQATKQLGLHPYHRPRRPLLSADQQRRRRTFARKYAKHDWRATMLSDEKIFNLFPSGNSKNDVVWAKNAASVPPRPRVSKSAGIMVWGGITYYGKPALIRLDGKVNAAAYKAALKHMLPAAKRLFGGRRWCFQQDGAPVHTAASTQEWLTNHVPAFIPKQDWPANSPDANGIEGLWGMLSGKVDARRPKSVDDLWRIIQD